MAPYWRLIRDLLRVKQKMKKWRQKIACSICRGCPRGLHCLKKDKIYFYNSYRPWGPQSRLHNFDEQSSPTQPSWHWQCWASKSKSPFPEQSGKHCRASSSRTLQPSPFQPFLQIQAPSTQKPWSEQVGSGQSTEKYRKKIIKFPKFQQNFQIFVGSNRYVGIQ